ncbi:MAG: HAD hydrolase-like protein [Humidesulfovibrio sp.]|uniref:HAD family hydrolase n=1 Tax=Humidesulfovibrio sp. TaxID=2910988 RepID=UPI0027EEEB55|nr:HAD hydrolase-like protein [Humidesulfovibrio sp.]MDQ7834261.1 HAD hydrolase-like protein [Humidesulfovibrio sp.]
MIVPTTVADHAGHQALVFDFDGVLVDSTHIKAEAFAEVYRPLGLDTASLAQQHFLAHLGVSRRNKFKYCQTSLTGGPSDPTEIDRLCLQFSKLVVARVLAAREIPGATDLLLRWHKRLPLYVNSATPDEELAEILHGRNLSQYFHAAYGSSRSKTENLAHILSEKMYDPERVIFFGDAISDWIAAKCCGVSFVGITAAPSSPLLEAGGQFPVCRDLREAAALLEERA